PANDTAPWRGGFTPLAQLADHLPIDFDAPFADQLLAIAPAADARRGQDLLVPLPLAAVGLAIGAVPLAEWPGGRSAASMSCHCGLAKWTSFPSVAGLTQGAVFNPPCIKWAGFLRSLPSPSQDAIAPHYLLHRFCGPRRYFGSPVTDGSQLARRRGGPANFSARRSTPPH